MHLNFLFCCTLNYTSEKTEILIVSISFFSEIKYLISRTIKNSKNCMYVYTNIKHALKINRALFNFCVYQHKIQQMPV